jgi:RHS repeat-associated protein
MGNPETSGGLSSYTPFGYAGGYTDPSGIDYFINRYYDPQTGQFLSTDVLGDLTGTSYVYGGDDPANDSDLSGLCATSLVQLDAAIPCRDSPPRRRGPSGKRIRGGGSRPRRRGFWLSTQAPGGANAPIQTVSQAPTDTTPTPTAKPPLSHPRDKLPLRRGEFPYVPQRL